MAKAAKTTLALTRDQFRTHAQPVAVVINGKEFKVPKKEFSTGSLGWYLSDKMDVTIDGVDVKVQIGLNLTIVGSKDLPGAAPAEAPPAAAPKPAASAPPAPPAGPVGTNEKGEADF
ncbi:hypothetical protein J0H58_35530 [bacterium]|nr:hypothetical protein [bacterium]